MPVNNFHPDYIEWNSEWEKCRDAYKGQKWIKVKGVKYLPRLSEQSNDEYDAYKGRALFYSITAKAVSAMVGMVVAKTPETKAPASMESYFKDLNGIQFAELLSSSLSEDLLMGRYGILIDRQVDNGPPQPYGYTAENIINWRMNADGMPEIVVLRENVMSSDPSDDFVFVNQFQYRVLRLVDRDTIGVAIPFPSMMDNPGNPNYIFNPSVNSDDLNGLVYTVTTYDVNLQPVKMVVPTNRGRPMGYIPFYVINPFGIGFGTTKPPVLDMVDINLSHYRTSADLEHGRHFTGLPTAVVKGVAPGTKLKIGSTTAWILPDGRADAKYLEFTGQGLQSLEKAMIEKTEQLASMSARLLGNTGNGSEAAETVRLRYMSETASLTTVVRAVEAGMNVVYKTIAIMSDENPNDVGITLDKEFLSSRMDAASVLKMTQSWLTGGMSTESYVYNLRRGDIIKPGRTDAEEIAALDKQRAELQAAQSSKGDPAKIN